MTTIKKIAANRRNAQKSTGPRTIEGKSVSRLNALRHGLRSRGGSMPAEAWQSLLRTREQFLEAWQPQTRDQRRLVARMAFEFWKRNLTDAS